MTLHKFFATYPCDKRQFARDLNISESGLYHYINLNRIPRLATAIKIHILTSGLVKHIDMLKDPKDADITVNNEDLL